MKRSSKPHIKPINARISLKRTEYREKKVLDYTVEQSHKKCGYVTRFHSQTHKKKT